MLGFGLPTAYTRIGAGASIIRMPPISGIAPPARKNAPDSAAARTIPMTALRVTRLSRLNSERRERQQREHARALDRDRKLALMLGAIARSPARYYLAALGDEAAERAHVFVVDLQRLVGAEAAYHAPSARTSTTHPAAATSPPPAFAAVVAAGTRAAVASAAATFARPVAASFRSF